MVETQALRRCRGPGILVAAGLLLSACSSPTLTSLPNGVSLHIQVPIAVGPVGRSLSAPRLLLPSATTLDISLKPDNPRFDPLEKQGLPIPVGASSVTVSFATVPEGTWVIAATAKDGSGQPLFQQTASFLISSSSPSLDLHLVPANPLSFAATTSSPTLIAQSVGAGSSVSWTVPAAATKVDGSFDLWLDPAGGLSGAYLQFSDGRAMSSPAVSVGAGAGAYVTVYNPGASGALANLILNPYRLTYAANGGAGSPPVDSKGYDGVSYGQATVLAATGLSLAGYQFDSWNTLLLGTGTKYAVGASLPMTASLTLYAQWQAIGDVSVGFQIDPVSPQVVSFTPASFTIVQTGTASLNCGNAGLSSGGSAWQWYVDGSPISDPSSGSDTASFVFKPALHCAQPVGQHTIGLKVLYGGVWYSGDFVATVTQ